MVDARLTKASEAADIEAQADKRATAAYEPVSKPAFTSHVSRLRYLLLPELLQRKTHVRQVLRSTAYLDGLRGFAAFIVYLAHNLLAANPIFSAIEVAFGFDGAHRNMINFPFIRLLFTGSHVAVPIFFVISGFVQARKPLQQIHANQDISSILASAIFRRPFRLYIPMIGSTLTFMILWHLLGITPSLNHHEVSFFADLRNYIRELWHWSYIFRSKNKGYFTDHGKVQEAWFDYNGHTWTIPIELQGSLLVYIFLLILCKATIKARIWMTSLAAIYFLVHGSCYTFTFLAGSVIAELELCSASARDFLLHARFQYRNHFFMAMLMIGCYLGAPPAVGFIYMSSEMMSQQPGFYYITKLVPWVYYDTIHFLVSIAAVMIIISVIALPFLRRPFESGIAQYFGRISFSLYLVHGPIIETWGTLVYAAVGKTVPEADSPINPWHGFLPVPQIGPLGFDLPFIVATVFILPVTLYAAEVCMRIFDGNSIWIARSMYERILKSS